MATFTLKDVRERTYKARDAWWTVLLVDPLASRLVLVTANRTKITPNQLTVGALFLGLGAAGCFAAASTPLMILGAVLYHLSFVLDCMDGKVARLKGNGSIFGAWLDYIFDRIRVLACAIALMAGQYAADHDTAFIWAALAVVFLDMLRYLDALEIYKVRSQMRSKLEKAMLEARTAEQAARQANGDIETSALEAELDGIVRQEPDEDMVQGQVTTHVLQQGFNQKFPWYARIRNVLKRGRIRPHLISGIEFQMAVFVIAPLLAAITTQAIIPTIAVAGAGLLAFEFVIIYKFWLSSRDYSRSLAKLEKRIAEAQVFEETPVGNHV